MLWHTWGGGGIPGGLQQGHRVRAAQEASGHVCVKEQEPGVGCPWERKGQGMSYFKGRLETWVNEVKTGAPMDRTGDLMGDAGENRFKSANEKPSHQKE